MPSTDVLLEADFAIDAADDARRGRLNPRMSYVDAQKRTRAWSKREDGERPIDASAASVQKRTRRKV